MKRKLSKKSRRKAARRGSALGSIVTVPFVVIASIIKFPFVAVGFLLSTIPSVFGAIVKFSFAAVAAVWRMIAAACGAILRIPFGTIVMMLFGCIAFVWRMAATVFGKLLSVLANKRGLTLGFLILAIVMFFAAFPKSTLGFALVAAILMAVVFWMSKQPSSFLVARNPELGKLSSLASLVPQTRDLEEIHALTPREFEEYVRDLLTDLGYRNLSVVGGQETSESTSTDTIRVVDQSLSNANGTYQVSESDLNPSRHSLGCKRSNTEPTRESTSRPLGLRQRPVTWQPNMTYG